jgi:hypothetical protein
MATTKPSPIDWSYKHSFGYISIKTWGNPFIVITEDKYFKGENWGYNYSRLEVECESDDIAEMQCKALNDEFKIDQTLYYTADESEKLLLAVQSKFPNAKIAS